MKTFRVFVSRCVFARAEVEVRAKNAAEAERAARASAVAGRVPFPSVEPMFNVAAQPHALPNGDTTKEVAAR